MIHTLLNVLTIHLYTPVQFQTEKGKPCPTLLFSGWKNEHGPVLWPTTVLILLIGIIGPHLVCYVTLQYIQLFINID